MALDDGADVDEGEDEDEDVEDVVIEISLELDVVSGEGLMVFVPACWVFVGPLCVIVGKFEL